MHPSPYDNMSKLHPVILERRIVPKVWGGTAISEMLGCKIGEGDPVGETWELFDRPDGSSLIRDGGGRTIADMMLEDPQGLLGEGVQPTPDGRFPLLLKFIDAREALSVQVHPGQGQTVGTGDGPKDEAWLVLNAGPRGRIVRGFTEQTEAAQIEAAVGSEAIEPLLHTFKPEAGDVVSIDAGVVHAMGPEVVIFEVQQNSDLTYRLWDWGRPREIHVDKGLAVLRSDDIGPDRVAQREIDEQSCWLVRGPYFGLRRCGFNAPATLETEGSFKVLTVLDGMAALGWRSGGDEPPMPVRKGDTVLIPAATEQIYLSPIGGIDFLWTDAGEQA